MIYEMSIWEGQEITGLQMLQTPQLLQFYNDNKDKFVIPVDKDVAVYKGLPAVIDLSEK